MAAAMDCVARFEQKRFAPGCVRALVTTSLGLAALSLSACARPWQLMPSSVEASLAPGEASDSAAAKTVVAEKKPGGSPARRAAGVNPETSPEASVIESLKRTVSRHADTATAATTPTLGEKIPAQAVSTTWPNNKAIETAQRDRGKKSPLSPPPAGPDPLSEGLFVQQTMNIQEVLKYAVENHPLLKSRKHEIELAEAKLIGAGLFPNPQLVIDTDTPTQEAGATEMSTRLMFTIPLGGRLGRERAVADAGIMRAQRALSTETENILFEAADAAVEVLYLQEEVTIQRKQVARIHELAKYIEQLAEARGPIHALIAQANVRELELREFNARALLAAARLRLSRAIGLESPRLVELTGDLTDEPLPRLSLERILAVVRETRPEIAESRAAVEEARREIELAYAESIPDLDIGPRYQDEFRDTGDSAGVRFDFRLPLFDRNEGPIAEGMAQLRVNQAMVRVTELKSINDVAEAFVELAPLQRELIQNKGRIARIRDEMLKVIRISLEVGQLTAPQAIDEIQRLGKLEEEDLKLRYRYNQRRVKLELFLGRPLRSFAEPGAKPEPPKDPFKDEPPLEEMPPAPKKASDETSREPRPFPPAIAGPELVTPASHEAPAGISFPTRLRTTVEPPADSEAPEVAEATTDDSPAEEPAANSATMDP